MNQRSYYIFSILVLLLAAFVLLGHVRVGWLPLACLLLGFLVRALFRRRYLEVFAFLIPLLPALAALADTGFPLNYLLLPLFFLAGIMAGEWLPGRGAQTPPLQRLPRFYPTFLLLLGIAFCFVVLRWSNLTLSPLAFFKDTPVAPTGQRLSFAIIFPVMELALFTLSPLFFLLLRRTANPQRVLVAFLCGQSVSILCSLVQRLQGWRSPGFSPQGLASDPTAFGFLSALAILLAWYLHYRFNARKLGPAFAFIALAGILNSTTRVGLLAVALAIVLFYWPERKKAIPALLAVAFAAAILLLSVFSPHRDSSSLMARLKTNIHEAGEAIQANREGRDFSGSLTANRDVLWRYAWTCLREFPLTGVGPGNFVFWVMAAHRGDYFHHLTANQYLFIASSLGLPGLAAFLLFCFALLSFRPWPEKCLLAAFLLFFLFNDYLWFPEIALAFWMVAGFGVNERERSPVLSPTSRALRLGGILAFAFLNIQQFSVLHPKNWAQVNSVAFDYGLHYPEHEQGRQFQWTGEKAGVYIQLDEHGRNGNFRLQCGAPLAQLTDKKQTVDVYWRGKLARRVVFRGQDDYPLQIEDRRHKQGFLEFRVRPAFNLKRMGLGEETRTLGIKLFGADVPGIEVVSPNGGENWLPNTIQNIRWHVRGNAAPAKVEVSSDGGATYATIAEPAAKDGLCSWLVAGGPSLNCRVRVSGGPGSLSDASDLPFAIASPPSRGGFSFAAPQEWTTASAGRDNWHVGDFDGDGLSDIMRCPARAPGGEVFLAHDGRFIAQGNWIAAGGGSDGWYVGDFDGDGRADLMRHLPSIAANEVFLSTGSRFITSGNWLTSGHGTDGWVVGDFDGDGRSDLLRHASRVAANEVFLSTGSRFVQSGIWLTGGNGADGWYVGDFNGDGRSDLMRSVPERSGAEVFLSQGGRFMPAGSWSGASPGADGWYVGDFNADKKSDIMRYAEWMAGSDVLLAGEAGFRHDGNWSGAGRGDADWLSGDFNGDGRSDLLRCMAGYGWEVLLAAAAGASPPAAGMPETGRWLGDVPPRAEEWWFAEDADFVEALRRRSAGGATLSLAAVHGEYEALKGVRCRRQKILKLLKFHKFDR